MTEKPQQLPEKIIQAVVTQLVSKSLGTHLRDITKHTKGMSPEEEKEAKALILDMIKVACDDFHKKMWERMDKMK